MTVFSFHPVKHITTGEGGMVTTNNPQFAESLRRFRNHGISSEARQRQSAGQWHYEMVLLGFNYRLPDFACALGSEQLKKLDSKSFAAARHCCALYRRFQRNSWSNQPCCEAGRESGVAPLSDSTRSWETDGGSCRRYFAHCAAENIGVNVHYIPVHLHPYYRDRFGYKGGEFPIAEDAYSRLISLPMFHGMTDQDVEDVIAAVRKVTGAYRR